MCALVSGVQTCALPISAMRPSGSRAESRRQSHQEHRPLEWRLLAAPRAFFMKNLLCCFAVSLFLIPGLALAAAIPDPPTIDAKSYALMDYDSGELIAASNPDEKRSEEHTSELQSLMRI